MWVLISPCHIVSLSPFVRILFSPQSSKRTVIWHGWIQTWWEQRDFIASPTFLVTKEPVPSLMPAHAEGIQSCLPDLDKSTISYLDFSLYKPQNLAVGSHAVTIIEVKSGWGESCWLTITLNRFPLSLKILLSQNHIFITHGNLLIFSTFILIFRVWTVNAILGQNSLLLSASFPRCLISYSKLNL